MLKYRYSATDSRVLRPSLSPTLDHWEYAKWSSDQKWWWGGYEIIANSQWAYNVSLLQNKSLGDSTSKLGNCCHSAMVGMVVTTSPNFKFVEGSCLPAASSPEGKQQIPHYDRCTVKLSPTHTASCSNSTQSPMVLTHHTWVCGLPCSRTAYPSGAWGWSSP